MICAFEGVKDGPVMGTYVCWTCGAPVKHVTDNARPFGTWEHSEPEIPVQNAKTFTVLDVDKLERLLSPPAPERTITLSEWDYGTLVILLDIVNTQLSWSYPSLHLDLRSIRRGNRDPRDYVRLREVVRRER